ncbi:MAG: CopD family protein, partial [Longimicrobiales bacterium]
HAAAVSPVLAMPLRAAHMAAGAVWLGGLLTLVRAFRAGPAQRDMLRAVSTAALWSFGFVAVTGVAQAVVFLGSPAALVQTGYGRIILGKATGLLALGAFGLHHRRLIARLQTDADGAVLRRSTTREIVLFIALIVLSAVLAFTPLPE